MMMWPSGKAPVRNTGIAGSNPVIIFMQKKRGPPYAALLCPMYRMGIGNLYREYAIYLYIGIRTKKATRRQSLFCLLTNCKIQFGLNLLYKYKGDQTVSHLLISHYLLMQFPRCLYHSLQVLIVFR